MDAMLEQSQKAYKGMQSRYNVLFNDKQQSDAEIETMGEQVASLQQQINELTAQRDGTTQEAQQLSERAERLEGEYSVAQAERDMWQLIGTKYQGLGDIAGPLNLSPGDSLEATDEMLATIATSINQEVERNVQTLATERLGTYNEGGNVGRESSLSLDALRTKMSETAGTDEYDKYAGSYYAMVQQSGEYPKPHPGPLDDIQ